MTALEAQPLRENARRAFLLAEKAWKLIQNHRMKNIDKSRLQEDILLASTKPDFNLYRFIDRFTAESKHS